MTISVPQRSGNYGPEEVVSPVTSSCEKAFASVLGAGTYPIDGGDTLYFVPGSAGPLTVTFPNWVSGDILDVEYDGLFQTAEEAEALPVPVFNAVVSLDNGVTWFGVNGSGSQAIPTSTDSGYRFSTPTARISVPILVTGPVLVRVVYLNDVNEMIGECHLNVRQLDSECVLASNGILVESIPQPIPIP